MRALLLVLLLAACAGRGPQTVYPGQYVPGSGPTALSRAPRTLIEVRPILDDPTRTPGALGEVRDEKGHVVQVLTLDPPPGRQFTDAFTAELRAAGHMPSGPGPRAVLEGAVQMFRFAGTPDKLTWDSNLKAQIAITLRQGPANVSRLYTADCADAGLLRPTPDAIAQVASACIANIMRQFRNDPAMAAVLSGG